MTTVTENPGARKAETPVTPAPQAGAEHLCRSILRLLRCLPRGERLELEDTYRWTHALVKLAAGHGLALPTPEAAPRLLALWEAAQRAVEQYLVCLEVERSRTPGGIELDADVPGPTVVPSRQLGMTTGEWRNAWANEL